MNILRNDDATTSESQTRNCYNDSSSKSAFGSRAEWGKSERGKREKTNRQKSIFDWFIALASDIWNLFYLKDIIKSHFWVSLYSVGGNLKK